MLRAAIHNPEREILTDRNFMAWLPFDFCHGEIELWVISELVAEASACLLSLIHKSWGNSVDLFSFC